MAPHRQRLSREISGKARIILTGVALLPGLDVGVALFLQAWMGSGAVALGRRFRPR